MNPRSDPASCRWSLGAVIACLVACNAFPDELRTKFASQEEPGGDAGAPDLAEAELLVVDDGAHRDFAVVPAGASDWIVWSSDAGSTQGYRVRHCRADGACEPRELALQICGETPHAVTGYLLGAGARVLVTNPLCPGWLCAFDATDTTGPRSCSYGEGLYRLFGGAGGAFGTVRGGEGASLGERRLVAFDPTVTAGTFEALGQIGVPALVPDGVSVAVSVSRVYFAEAIGAASFRVAACPHALASCGAPAAVGPPRSGVLSAMAATDAELFVASASGLEHTLVRVAIPSGDEQVVATSAHAIGGLTVAGGYLYFSEDGTVKRAELDGAAPRAIGRVPAAISHLVPSPGGGALYALARAGVYRLPLAPP